LVRALEQLPETATVLEAGTQNLIVTFADEILHDAVVRMVRNDIGRLPVVQRANPRRIEGYLGRASVRLLGCDGSRKNKTAKSGGCEH
jgi:CIC family chloride channel protein